MDTYKIWILEIFAITAVLYSAVSIIVDPFGVFGDVFFHTQKISMLTNQRFHKIAYLEKNFHKYNSYLIGGSRIAAIKPEWAEKYIPGSKFYNLFVSAATEYDNLIHLKYIVENYKAENIILQVHINDLYSYFGLSETTVMTEPHYQVSGKNRLLFYLPYLSPGGELLARKLRYALGIESTENLKTVVEETGERCYKYEEKLIAQDHEAYIKNEKTFHIRDKKTRLKMLTEVTRASSYTNLFVEDGMVRGIKSKECIKALREMKRICDQNGVNLIVLTVPHNHMMMDMFDTADYLDFIRQLADICPFWDFSGYNSVTADDRNYYEWSHYRVTVAKYILARVFNDPSVAVPDDFGVFVTKDNIEAHLSELNENIEVYRKNSAHDICHFQ